MPVRVGGLPYVLIFSGFFPSAPVAVGIVPDWMLVVEVSTRLSGRVIGGFLLGGSSRARFLPAVAAVVVVGIVLVAAGGLPRRLAGRAPILLSGRAL